MSANQPGIWNLPFSETPISVIDVETTGLTPGHDRVVEISVVRVDPGEKPRLVFDSLVNPHRPMAATEIHGITDEDVLDAPTFSDIGGDLIRSLDGSVVSAFNVYFDIKFLRFELGQINLHEVPPHFCLMYMRPMLGIGKRCRLEEACRDANINLSAAHTAGSDALASAELITHYSNVMSERGIQTFSDLGKLKKYKFVDSFSNKPYAASLVASHPNCSVVKGRSMAATGAAVHIQVPVTPEREYWEELKGALGDLEMDDEEVERLTELRTRLGLAKETVRRLHAKAFSSVIAQCIDDKWLDDREVRLLRRVRQCLSKAGWAPGD